jgi:hypothetical protein
MVASPRNIGAPFPFVATSPVKEGLPLLWKEGTAGALIMAPTITLDGDADVAAPVDGRSFAEMCSR